jgi:hypothetical protein
MQLPGPAQAMDFPGTHAVAASSGSLLGTELQPAVSAAIGNQHALLRFLKAILSFAANAPACAPVPLALS